MNHYIKISFTFLLFWFFCSTSYADQVFDLKFDPPNPTMYMYTNMMGINMDDISGWYWPVKLSIPFGTLPILVEGQHNQSFVAPDHQGYSTNIMSYGISLFDFTNEEVATFWHSNASRKYKAYIKARKMFILMYDRITYQYDFGERNLYTLKWEENKRTQVMNVYKLRSALYYKLGLGQSIIETLDLGVTVSQDGQNMGPWIEWTTLSPDGRNLSWSAGYASCRAGESDWQFDYSNFWLSLIWFLGYDGNR